MSDDPSMDSKRGPLNHRINIIHRSISLSTQMNYLHMKHLPTILNIISQFNILNPLLSFHGIVNIMMQPLIPNGTPCGIKEKLQGIGQS